MKDEQREALAARVNAETPVLVAHAQWLWEKHDARIESTRGRAAGVMGAAGALLALTYNLVPKSAQWPVLALAGAGLVCAVVSFVRAIQVLRPGDRLMPDLQPLREEYAALAESGTSSGAIHVIAATMLDPNGLRVLGENGDPRETVIDALVKDGERRAGLLQRGYRWLIASLALLSIAGMLGVVFERNPLTWPRTPTPQSQVNQSPSPSSQ